ncbi:hypothetical protein P5673_032879 [Acropora cervicornis]|uniref:Uncharacterized protein n=1 Tax=Acropora cervicornis TaxID=6130 RepID=A0AAD9URG8_ACRCE|nr:hypothetical protein P5673_032879 [Acropora cervicornis]
MDNEEAKHRVLAAAVSCCCVKERRPKGPIEMSDTVWWQHGYANWTDNHFKKRLIKCYSVTNMGFVGANKRFLWADVGAPGSVHDSTLSQSSPIFTDIESGRVLPNNVLRLPGHVLATHPSLDVPIEFSSARLPFGWIFSIPSPNKVALPISRVPSLCQLLAVRLPTGYGKPRRTQMWVDEQLPCSYQRLTCTSLPTFSLSRRTWTLSLTQEGAFQHQGVAEGCCDFGKPLYNPPLGSQRPHSLLPPAESFPRL